MDYIQNPPPAVVGSAVYLLAFLMIYQKDYNSIINQN